MIRDYKIISLDHLVNGDTPLTYVNDPRILKALANVSYQPLLRNYKPTRDDSLFCKKDSYNQKLSDEYWNMAQQSDRIAPCGMLHFDHIWVLGRDGLRVDVDNGIIFVGQILGWSRDYFDWWIESSRTGFIKWVNTDVLSADFGPSEYRDNDIVMMKYPGYDIFGHWLLDYIPQLTICQYADLAAETRFVFDHLTSWMEDLLRASGVENTECYQHRLTEHSNLHAPTGAKNGYALGQPVNSLAWNKLRAYFNHLNCGRDATGVERLFVSRSKWAGQRALANYETLEKLMSSLGFEIFFPEQHSLQAQAHYFSMAKVIVGEDGSGLHSVMFTNPGATLGVLMQEDRSNLWHAGICHSSGHRIAYHQLINERDSAGLDLESIKSFVNSLL